MFEAIDRLRTVAGGGEGSVEGSERILTVPNAISFARLLLIPVFVWLLAAPGLEAWGLLLLAAVVASDWLDGWVARRTGSVSKLGKFLDPLSDRLVIAAALITFGVQEVMPWWAVVAVVVRDVLVLAFGAMALAARGTAIPVRWIGKVATLDLMVGIPMIAWAGYDLPLAAVAAAVGWLTFGVGLGLYYVAALLYVRDLAALRTR